MLTITPVSPPRGSVHMFTITPVSPPRGSVHMLTITPVSPPRGSVHMFTSPGDYRHLSGPDCLCHTDLLSLNSQPESPITVIPYFIWQLSFVTCCRYWAVRVACQVSRLR